MTLSLMPKPLEDYAAQYTSAEQPVLAALNAETHRDVHNPVMLSGHVQGALLQMLSRMIQPSCILEIGTYTGYSAICLAQGLKPGGVLHTLERNEALRDIASRHFDTAGLQDSIVQHFGNAADTIATLDGPFDLVFIDADKAGYSNYYDLVFGKVPVGGYIIADNVLFNGEVVLPEAEQSKAAKAIHSFNNKVKADTRVEHLLLPVRDGLMVVRKLRD